MTKITIKSDGGSRGNPGPAAIGYVVYLENKLIKKHGQKIGEATNNTAEYKSIIKALQWLQKNIDSFHKVNKDNPIQIECLMDSKLVVNQLSGNFKIKQPHLQLLANQAFAIIKDISQQITFKHIKREYNQESDLLLNQALDKLE